MVERETIERRLFKLEQTLRKLQELSKVSWDEYIKDEQKIVYDSLKKIDDFKNFAKHVLSWL